MNGLTLFNNRTTDIFDRFFGYDDFWTTPTVKQVSDQHRPSVNEQEDKYQIYLTAPGLEKSDFNITVEGNLLTISYDASNKKENYAFATKYSKTYTIPNDCDIDAISASYKSGVMVVTLPKSEAAKPKTIDIK